MPSEPAKPYQSPVPPIGMVLWSTNPGSPDRFPAIVTRRSPAAISVMVVPEESKGGIPKDAVLHVSDPKFAQLMDQSSGVWDYTEESKLLQMVARVVFPDREGNATAITPAMVAFVNRLVK